MPDLSITVPAVDAHVQPLQPFLVSGRASDAGFPEPHQIDTVTVQVDAGPVVEARVTQIPDKAVSLFEYSAEVTVTGGSDPPHPDGHRGQRQRSDRHRAAAGVH